jgi:uncharacterized damage-inducible protein DinB
MVYNETLNKEAAMLPEVSQYLAMIEDLRGQVEVLITDLPAEALNWRPLVGGVSHATNSLAVLAAHVAGAEHFWIAEVVGGYPATRVRSKEFEVEAAAAAALLEQLAQVGRETRTVLEELTAEELAKIRVVHGRETYTRWAILHAIEHTALHLGQMQLTRQLWEDGQTDPGPRWFERLPPISP